MFTARYELNTSVLFSLSLVFEAEGYYIYFLFTDVRISKYVYTAHLAKSAGNESSRTR